MSGAESTWSLGGLSILLLTAGASFASESPQKAAPGGSYWIDARLRGENVSQDNSLDDATAITLRTRIGYETKNIAGFQLLIEGENILAIQDDYYSTTNDRSRYSVVADPEDSEINRAYLSYTGLPATSVSVGRQKIILDNARFLGNVGWRQNEQTFDSLMLVNSSIPNTELTLAYIDSVRRIFGPDSRNGKTDMSSPIINVSYRGLPEMAVTAYGYFLDFDDAPNNSHRTIGVKITGTQTLDTIKFSYGLEFADQQDYRSGSQAIDADYHHVTLEAAFHDIKAGVGYERLGGDGTYAFQTPLATGHAFNGWADQFLSTPAGGLTDTYLNFGGQLEKVKLKAVYHFFESDVGGEDYGREIDLIATRKFGKQFLAGAKYANYSADQRGVDTSKFWLFGQFRY